jgi:glycosyltransferase involved in cell wall biosynthesis
MLRAFLFDRSLPLTGGVAHSFLIFGRHRDRARIALHAVSCQGIEAGLAAGCADAGIVPHDIGDRGYGAPGMALRRLVLEYRPHVVLCCSLKPYLLALAAARGLKTRVVFWHVAITDILDRGLRRFTYRWLARRRDVLANSQATLAAASYRWHRGRSRVVYLGVEDLPVAAAPVPACLPRGARPILYTASFVAFKQHKILLDAFAHVAAGRDDVHLLLIGVGPLRKAAMRQAEATGHGARIHFLGARDDVRALLRLADIYAHPAVGEGFGIAVVEAMLAGLPIVAARAGALPELVDGVSNGLLCAPGDARDLAACLLRLLDDPASCRSLGAAARHTAVTRFTPAAYADNMTTVIEAYRA